MAGATRAKIFPRASSRGSPSLIGLALCDAATSASSDPLRLSRAPACQPVDRRPRPPHPSPRASAARRQTCDGVSPTRQTSDAARYPRRPAASNHRHWSAPMPSASHPNRSRLARPALGSDAGPRRRRIEHHAAADRDRRRIRADDEAIAARQHRRRLEPQTRTSALVAGRDLVDRRAGDRDAAQQFRGAVVQAHARAVFERLCRRQQIDLGIDAARHAQACPASTASRRATTSPTSTPPRLMAVRWPATASVDGRP